jgi:hypothetical protein
LNFLRLQRFLQTTHNSVFKEQLVFNSCLLRIEVPYTNDNYNIFNRKRQGTTALRNNAGIIPPTAKAVGFLIRGDRDKFYG